MNMYKLARRVQFGLRQWGLNPTLLAQPLMSAFGSLQTFVEPKLPADVGTANYRFYFAFRPVDPDLDGSQVEAQDLGGILKALGYDGETGKFGDIDVNDYVSLMQLAFPHSGITIASVLNVPGVVEGVRTILRKPFE